MTKKCGATHTDTIWNYGRIYTCTRNKGHHGDHTMPEPVSDGRQQWWRSNRWFNEERYCGATFAAFATTNARCERKPGHKTWHKSWYFTQYITWKEVQ